MSSEKQTQRQNNQYALETHGMNVYYGDFHAVKDVELRIKAHNITALIGPSGCGKSTVLRVFNRMNDLIPAARVTGDVLFHGRNLYDPQIDSVKVRRRIGMVFQSPNPFPNSIYNNVAYGPRILGWHKSKQDMDNLVEQSLRSAALWEEVKDKLGANGLDLSGGQQQRLCIARTLAIEPEVILMDEPASSLDPVSTQRIEDLMADLRKQYTIIIVTHNMEQASRVSDETAFFLLDDDRGGILVEQAPTQQLFQAPQDERTEQYISGRFG